MIKYILLGIILLISTITDIKYMKIPNWITFPGVIAGLFINIYMHEPLLIYIIPVIILFFIGMFQIMGLGDIKLFMCVSAIMGYNFLVYTLAIATIGMISFELIRDRKNLVNRIKQSCMAMCMMNRSYINENDTKIPFAPYILFAFVIQMIGGLL